MEDMTSRSNGDDDGDQQTESTTVHDHTADAAAADATNDNSSSETAAQNSVSCAAVLSWGQQKSQFFLYVILIQPLKIE